MPDDIVCLDSSVLVKFLTREEPVGLSDAAHTIVTRAVAHGRIVLPAFAWAEVGSVLRKKVRQQMLQDDQATAVWTLFQRLPVEYVESAALRQRAWEIAATFDLPTLDDAAFLACAEIVAARDLWTADDALLRALGSAAPLWVRHLREIA